MPGAPVQAAREDRRLLIQSTNETAPYRSQVLSLSSVENLHQLGGSHQTGILEEVLRPHR